MSASDEKGRIVREGNELEHHSLSQILSSLFSLTLFSQTDAGSECVIMQMLGNNSRSGERIRSGKRIRSRKQEAGDASQGMPVPEEVRHLRYFSAGLLAQKLPIVLRDRTSPT